MALPANVLPPSIGMVELSIDGTAWVDVSDQLTVIEPPAQTRVRGEIAVVGEDTMVGTVGKREPVEITLRGPYINSTTTTNAWVILVTQWTTANENQVDVRWAPSGTATNAIGFATATATGGYTALVDLTYPGQDAAGSDPLVYEAVIRAPEIFSITKS